MVLTGSMGVDSYDPDTGKPIWHHDGPTEQYVASPVLRLGAVLHDGRLSDLSQLDGAARRRGRHHQVARRLAREQDEPP